MPWLFARCPFLTSCSISGHIWLSGGLMRTIGENIDNTAFTFSARKKKDSIFLKIFFESELLKDIEIYQKKTNWRVRGTLSLQERVVNAICLCCFAQFQRNWIVKMNIKQTRTTVFLYTILINLGCHLEFLIYDVHREKTSGAIFEFWLAWQYHVRTRGKVRPLWITLFHSFPL